VTIHRLLLLTLFVLGLLSTVSLAQPAVVFQVEEASGRPTAELCHELWQRKGAALADDILPAGVVADTVHCYVLTSSRFNELFAGRLPDWGVGVAMPPGRLIALDFQRLQSHGPGPESVFLHEMAHALLFQGAGAARLPTWLHEGVAMRASGEWRVTDTVGVILEGHLPSLASLDGPFPRGSAAAQRAYRTSLLAVNWLEREHGPGAVQRVVLESRRAGDFDAGFHTAVGEVPDQFERRFADAMRLRFGWVLLIFRWPTLFVIMAVIFAAGAVRKIILGRRRDLDDDDDWEHPDST